MQACLGQWDMLYPSASRKQIRGDGNCQFRSLSWASYNTSERHADIRSTVCDYMMHNYARYKPFIGDDSGYLKNMRRNGTYGDRVTLQAFCDAYHSNVAVLDDRNQVTLFTGQRKVSAPYKVLLYEGGVHYNAVEPSHASPTSYMLNTIKPHLNIENSYRFDG